MLAAARGLCGHEAGIACILGTGSNSCFYNGEEIISNISPLGFILGDEGSGAVLGKLQVGDVLKNQLPSTIKEAFLKQFDLVSCGFTASLSRTVFWQASLLSWLNIWTNLLSAHSCSIASLLSFAEM